jgi:hypothetical protein
MNIQVVNILFILAIGTCLLLRPVFGIRTESVFIVIMILIFGRIAFEFKKSIETKAHTLRSKVMPYSNKSGPTEGKSKQRAKDVVFLSDSRLIQIFSDLKPLEHVDPAAYKALLRKTLKFCRLYSLLLFAPTPTHQDLMDIVLYRNNVLNKAMHFFVKRSELQHDTLFQKSIHQLAAILTSYIVILENKHDITVTDQPIANSVYDDSIYSFDLY